MLRPRRDDGRVQLYAAENGLSPVLDVAVPNRGAIAFYERSGWRRAGTAELMLSGEPWRPGLVLFVLG